jgi:hypothetical protein
MHRGQSKIGKYHYHPNANHESTLKTRFRKICDHYFPFDLLNFTIESTPKSPIPPDPLEGGVCN